jgi:hypothetical protein
MTSVMTGQGGCRPGEPTAIAATGADKPKDQGALFVLTKQWLRRVLLGGASAPAIL